MKAFGSFLGRHADVGPLLLRVGIGLVFVMHGWQKFFDIGVSNYAAFIQTLSPSVPLADVVAPVQAFLELVGGILLILGLFTRFAVVPMIVISLSALWLVRSHIGFITPNAPAPGAGAELDTAILAGELCLLFIGPGRFGLDAMLGWERSEEIAAPSGRNKPPVAA